MADEIRETVAIVVDDDPKKLKSILSTYVKDKKVHSRAKSKDSCGSGGSGDGENAPKDKPADKSKPTKGE